MNTRKPAVPWTIPGMRIASSCPRTHLKNMATSKAAQVTASHHATRRKRFAGVDTSKMFAMRPLCPNNYDAP